MRILLPLLIVLLAGCSDDPAANNADPDGGNTDVALDAESDRDTAGGPDMSTPDIGASDTGTPDLPTLDMATADTGIDMTADIGVDMAEVECIDEPNAGSPPANTCQHGGADWIAWMWVPAEDMTVGEIQMHTDEGFAALFADDASRPGTVLAEGALSAPDAEGWRTLTVSPPVSVTAGTTFWLGEDVTTCSTVEDGTEFTYFTSNATAGPWNGPFMAHPFTARVTGTCP